MKKVINTTNAPAAIGPYSQAMVVGDTLYTSGQIPVDPKTGEVAPGGAAGQAKQSLENIKAILEEAGTTFENVFKTTVFIKDMNDFATINEVYSSYFPTNPPSRSCVEVARLPKDVLVEIEVIAKI